MNKKWKTVCVNASQKRTHHSGHSDVENMNWPLVVMFFVFGGESKFENGKNTFFWGGGDRENNAFLDAAGLV